MNIYEHVHDWCTRTPGLDDHATAKHVVETIPDASWRDVILPLVLETVRNDRRQRVRVVEQSVAVSNPPKRRGTGVPVAVTGGFQPNPELRRLLNQSISLDGKGTKVTHGQATYQQIEQRIEYLTKHVRGCQRSIQLHQEELATLRVTGAKCLNDVFKKRAA